MPGGPLDTVPQKVEVPARPWATGDVIVGIIKEFREFAERGNLFDIAVGFVLGAAFNDLVKSFTTNILMPPIEFALREAGWQDLFLVLTGGQYATAEEARAAGELVLTYGEFLTSFISFGLTALALFLFVRSMNRWRERRQSGEAPAEETRESPNVPCPFCRTEIPREATRCPHCTSDLPETAGAESPLTGGSEPADTTG